MDAPTVLLVVTLLLVIASAWTRAMKSHLRVVSAITATSAAASAGIVVGLTLKGSSTLTMLILCAAASAAWYGIDQFMSRMAYAEYVESIGHHMDTELEYAGATRIMETGSKWGSAFSLWKVAQMVMVALYFGYATLALRFNPAPINLVAMATLGFLVAMSAYQVVRYTVRSEMVYAKFFRMNPDLV